MSDVAGRRVAVYARHSTEDQAGSVEAQLDRCREWVAAHGGTVVAEYADRARSGRTVAGREQMQRLLNDLQGKNVGFEVLVSEDLSRLSRSLPETGTLYNLLEFYDVALVTVTDGRTNGLVVGLRGTMNAEFVRDLADKTRRGLMAAVRRGGAPGGNRLYGYAIVRAIGEDGKPVRGVRRIVPEEAKVVRQIFRDYANGATFAAIRDGLNAAGIVGPTGGSWTGGQLYRHQVESGILRHGMYVGQLELGRVRKLRHPVTGKRIGRPRPRSELLVVPAPDLAIVDRALFDRVQKRLDVHSEKVRRHREKRETKVAVPKPVKAAKTRSRPAADRLVPAYITSRRSYCRDCGDVVASVTRGYLACRSRSSGRDCSQRYYMHRADVARMAQRAITAALAGRAPTVLAAVQAHVKILARRGAAKDRHTARLATERERVQRQLMNVHAALADGGGAALRARTREIERELTALARSIGARRRDARHRGSLPSKSKMTAIAARAVSILRSAMKILAGRPKDPVAAKVVQEALARIVVGYAGPGREGLGVTVEFDGEAVYRLGTGDVPDWGPQPD